MSQIRSTIAQGALLLVLAFVVGLSINAVRGRDSVKLTRDYKPRIPTNLPRNGESAKPANGRSAARDVDAEAEDAGEDARQSTPQGAEASEPAVEGTAASKQIRPDNADESQPAADNVEDGASAERDHPFGEVSFDEAVELFESENRDMGLIIFVDARNDYSYEQGHIPGALQLDFYRYDYYLPHVLNYAYAAEKVIIYCTGGDCEDSKLVGNLLYESGIPPQNLYIFTGGWEAWRESDMPVTEGAEP